MLFVLVCVCSDGEVKLESQPKGVDMVNGIAVVASIGHVSTS
jgi:hypothetical protein